MIDLDIDREETSSSQRELGIPTLSTIRSYYYYCLRYSYCDASGGGGGLVGGHRYLTTFMVDTRLYPKRDLVL